MFNVVNNLYFEAQESGVSSVLKKRGNPFSGIQNSQSKKRFKVLESDSSSRSEENLSKPTYIFQEVNYGSDIYPLDPLPFPEIKFSLKSKNTPIKYSYEEIEYLKKMKNEKNLILIKLFNRKFKKELNYIAFYRLKITCVNNPIVIDKNGEWDHIINQQNKSKIEYDEKLMVSFMKRKLKYEDAYREYCTIYPNSVNFFAFSKKMCISKKRL